MAGLWVASKLEELLLEPEAEEDGLGAEVVVEPPGQKGDRV